MGIMPADREQKWQRVFRRFGLPDTPQKDGQAATKTDNRTGANESGREPAQDNRSARKK